LKNLSFKVNQSTKFFRKNKKFLIYFLFFKGQFFKGTKGKFYITITVKPFLFLNCNGNQRFRVLKFNITKFKMLDVIKVLPFVANFS